MPRSTLWSFSHVVGISYFSSLSNWAFIMYEAWQTLHTMILWKAGQAGNGTSMPSKASRPFLVLPASLPHMPRKCRVMISYAWPSERENQWKGDCRGRQKMTLGQNTLTDLKQIWYKSLDSYQEVKFQWVQATGKTTTDQMKRCSTVLAEHEMEIYTTCTCIRTPISIR